MLLMMMMVMMSYVEEVEDVDGGEVDDSSTDAERGKQQLLRKYHDTIIYMVFVVS
jgi:hypothetical protein